MRDLEWLILTRHGESTANVAHDSAWRDRTEELDVPERDADVPLSETGRAQAAAFGRRLLELPPDERPTAVVASPYLRTATTARIALAQGLSLPISFDERLRDRELGILDGLTPWGVRARHPDEAARIGRMGKFYYRPPGGESWTDVALRLRSVYHDIDLDHPGGRVLVVAHDAIVVLTRYIAENLSEHEILEIEKTRIDNCSLTRWHRENGTLNPVEFNDTAHLDTLAA